MSEARFYRWWVCIGTIQTANGHARVAVQPWQGVARWSRTVDFTLAANRSDRVLEIPRAEIGPLLGGDSVLVCDVTPGENSDRAWYFDGLPREMRSPEAALCVTQQDDGDHGTVTVATDRYARVVTLDAEADIDDNYFELLPGETRTIGWKRVAGELEGSVRVTCRNAA